MAFVDETLVCKDCGKEFILAQVSRNFMQKRALRISQFAAVIAVIRDVVIVKVERRNSARCLL